MPAAVIIHVSIALSSLAYTTLLWIYPRPGRFPMAYALVGLTIASGTFLVVRLPAHMAEACLSGLVYLALASIGIVSAHARLRQRSMAYGQRG